MVQHGGRSAVPKNRLALPGLATALHPWSSLSPLYLWSQILSAWASFSTPKVALAPSGAWELQIDFFPLPLLRSTRFPSGRLLTASRGSQPIRRRRWCERHLRKVSVCLLEPRGGNGSPMKMRRRRQLLGDRQLFPICQFLMSCWLVVFILARTFINSGGCNSASRIFLEKSGFNQ